MRIPFRKQIIFCIQLLKFPFKYKEYSLGKRFAIIFDYYRLYRWKRLLMSEYYDFEFDKCSKFFRDEFLGWAEQGYYLKTLNPIKYYTLARNKYLAHLCLEKAGIPMPQLLGYYNPYEVNAKEKFAKKLLNLQKEKKVPFVIKATESSHGEGVFVVNSVIEKEDKLSLNLVNGNIVFLADVLKNDDELIVEKLIKQTEQFSSFNRTSVNTVRFMTTLYPTGEAKIIATFIKIGRNGAYVDNAGAGGNVDANIDVETGEINNVIRFSGFRNVESIENHPDTGVLLNGIRIDNWDAIKAKVVEYQQLFPFVKAAGWDIAITDDGPIVIEVNDSWDRTGQLFINRGWKKEIKDCFNAWNIIGYRPIVERATNNITKNEIEELQNLFN